MRAAIVGVFFRDRPDERRAFGKELAEATHLDARAVEGALFVAEVAALASRLGRRPLSSEVEEALAVVAEPSLRQAIVRAIELAEAGEDGATAAKELGTTGFVVHTVPFALFCFLRVEGDPLRVITEVVRAGGDTDSIAAIVGAWLGAAHGEEAFPKELRVRLQRGPFGRAHLEELGGALELVAQGRDAPAVRFSWLHAFARNLLLYPLVLFHAVRVVFNRG